MVDNDFLGRKVMRFENYHIFKSFVLSTISTRKSRKPRRHGNPSWFSGLQDESNFQTKISHKWLEILVSFFHIMKIWYFGLHLALVTCYYPNLSKNGSHLKKSVQKFEFCC